MDVAGDLWFSSFLNELGKLQIDEGLSQHVVGDAHIFYLMYFSSFPNLQLSSESTLETSS